MVELGSDRYVNMTSLKAVQVPEEMTWQLDKIWRQNYSLLNNSNGLIDTKTPNVVFVRPTETPDGFEMVIHYSKQQFASEQDADYYTEIMYQNFTQVVSNFTKSVAEAQSNFTQSYSAIFGESYKDLIDTMPLALEFGQQALANLFGGLGYFYGPIRILNESDGGKSWFYDEPAGLFTCTPSRPYFPRGFLWDEGFHS